MPTENYKYISKVIFTLLMYFLFSPIGFAQSNIDSLEGFNHYKKSIKLEIEGNLKLSSEFAEKAKAYFIKTKNWVYLDSCFYRLYNNAVGSDKYTKSISIAKEALEIIPLSYKSMHACFQSVIGQSYYYLGNNYQSISYFERGLKLFQETRDTMWLNFLYGELGIVYTQFGDYQKAIENLHKAKHIAILENDNIGLEYVYYNLILAYIFDDNSVDALTQLNLLKKINPVDDGSYSYLQAKIAIVDNDKNNGLKKINESIRLYSNLYGPNDQSTLAAKSEKITILRQLKRFSEATIIIENILPLYENENDKTEFARLLIENAAIHFDEGLIEKSLNLFQKSITQIIPTFQQTDPLYSPKAEELFLDLWLIDAFEGKGNCYLNKYKKTSNSYFLKLANDNYSLAIKVADMIKSDYTESSSKIKTSLYTRVIFENLIKVKLLLSQHEKDKKYNEEAFMIAQRANAYNLKELLSKKKAKEIINISPMFLNKQDSLDHCISILERKLKESASDNIDSIRNVIFDFKTERHLLEEQIENAYPKYKNYISDLNPVSIIDIQNNLESNQLVIKYFYGQDNLYTFTISSLGLEIHSQEINKSLENDIYIYRKCISDLSFVQDSSKLAEDQYLSTSHRLYNTLLSQPLASFNPEEIKRLIIIGDGLINTIPFQSLLMAPSTSWKKNTSLLIQKYAISYCFFSGMLINNNSFEDLTDFKSFGIEFDNYTLDYLKSISKDSIENKIILDHLRSENLTTLPFSDEEAIELAKLMDGESWTNQKATKTAFELNGATADILHVATHSIVDIESPNLSALIFTKDKENEDIFFRFEDFIKTKFNAHTITLSACNTAYGKNILGEGLHSLARSFRFAGVESITATLWSISDESSKKLILNYYTNLNLGQAKDIALQNAQLNFLNNDDMTSPEFRIPIYWASWMPIGNTRSICTPKENNLFNSIIIGIISLICIAFSFMFYKAMKSNN